MCGIQVCYIDQIREDEPLESTTNNNPKYMNFQTDEPFKSPSEHVASEYVTQNEDPLSYEKCK